MTGVSHGYKGKFFILFVIICIITIHLQEINLNIFKYTIIINNKLLKIHIQIWRFFFSSHSTVVAVFSGLRSLTMSSASRMSEPSKVSMSRTFRRTSFLRRVAVTAACCSRWRYIISRLLFQRVVTSMINLNSSICLAASVAVAVELL